MARYLQGLALVVFIIGTFVYPANGKSDRLIISDARAPLSLPDPIFYPKPVRTVSYIDVSIPKTTNTTPMWLVILTGLAGSLTVAITAGVLIRLRKRKSEHGFDVTEPRGNGGIPHFLIAKRHAAIDLDLKGYQLPPLSSEHVYPWLRRTEQQGHEPDTRQGKPVAPPDSALDAYARDIRSSSEDTGK